MSRVHDTLIANRDSGKGSLVGYYPAGYPTLEGSVEALVAMAENGCDILEIGVPYSDPVMDGLVIQVATEEARAAGFVLGDLFEVIRQVRARIATPILVMSYWNPVLRFGVEKFALKILTAGAQGMITPDLVPDEAEQWVQVSEANGLDRVFLVAPSSSDTRVAANSAASQGFVYSVSTMGITGERTQLDALARGLVARVNSLGSTPTCVGVGISTADQVREVNGYSDGAIVGTAFVKAYQDDGLLGLVAKTKELTAGLG